MEAIIRKYLSHGADKLRPFENVPNNSVYSFESNGEAYIFKLFRSAFLEGYHGARKDEFDVFGKTYHIYNALDTLVYTIEVGDEKMMAFAKEYLKQFV